MTQVSEAVERVETLLSGSFGQFPTGADLRIILAALKSRSAALEKIKSSDCRDCQSDLIAFAALSDEVQS